VSARLWPRRINALYSYINLAEIFQESLSIFSKKYLESILISIILSLARVLRTVGRQEYRVTPRDDTRIWGALRNK